MESQILQKESEDLADSIRPNGQGRFWQRDCTEKRQNLEFQGNKSNNQVSKQRKLAFEMATESWAIREEKEEMGQRNTLVAGVCVCKRRLGYRCWSLL